MAEEKTGCPECSSPSYTSGKCDVCGYEPKAEEKSPGKEGKKKA